MKVCCFGGGGASSVAYLTTMMLLSSTRAFSHSRLTQFAGRLTASRLFAATMDSDTAVSSNPLLEQEGLPKFSKIDPKSDITPAVETLLEKLQKDFAALEQDITDQKIQDYQSVLDSVEQMQFGLGYAWGVAGHLNGVKNSDELREAYEANQPKVVQAMTQFSQSKPLYDALSELQKKFPEESKESDPTPFEEMQIRRAVENSLRSMTLGGVGLEGEAKERFNEMKLRRAALGTTFSNNVLDDTKSFSLTIDDASKMEGVPASAKAMWANAHVMHLAKENPDADKAEMDPEKGPWRITLDMPSYIACLSHCPDRAIREQVYRANIQKASELSSDGAKNNVPLIYEILELRQEMASLLGFNNYAEMSLASKMAPSVESVAELTDLIAAKALPAAKKELEEITKLAQQTDSSLTELKPWDITYWSERLKESKFDMTEEELRPYFALPAVLKGMFGLVERIFDISVQAADGEAEIWHPDVQFFKVFDKSTNQHIASFYLDPYSRPENKRGGAWMDVCIGKSSAVKREIPVAYLTCNGSPPVGDTPSLMTFREVETLFHEFGHGLQHMLTTATVGDVAGINGVEWDAVELPSQFMENFCYDKATVYGFAKHWQTGEPLPEEMFQKLCDQKTFNAGMMACRQLYFGQLDMELHANYDPKKKDERSIFDVQKEIASKYIPYSMPLPEDRFLCSFSHIFAGGYSAAYYSYKWAEVMSADAFSAFEDVGLENEEEVKRVGKLFRDTVLSLGGGIPPMEVFKRFRGREPSPDALLRHNGLS